MNKKWKNVVMSSLLASLFGITACTPTIIEGIDKNKTQIYVYLFDGGYGSAWIESTRDEFNENSDKFQVILKPQKEGVEDNMYSSFQTDTPVADIYYTTGTNMIKQMISQGFLLDLSDVYAMKVDGENGGTIREKLRDANLYEEVFSDSITDREGVYGLPYGDSCTGLVYDHDLFLEKKWARFANEAEDGQALSAQGIVYTTEKVGTQQYLKFVSSENACNYQTGDFILEAGKDNKFGTYDDGQPKTVAEWDEMLGMIKGAGARPFIFSGAFADYTLCITDSVFAQYEGMDNYEIFYNYSGVYDGPTSALDGVEITPQTGNKVYRMDGLKKGIEFIEDYLCASGNAHPSYVTGTNHAASQTNFILGYRNTQGNPQSAMLIDGFWWEYEARATFAAVADGYQYGQREYRMMLLPDFDGQMGGNGDGTGSVLTATDTGMVVAYDSKDDEKNQAMKEFIAMTCSDKSLQTFHKLTGTPRPYNYELSESDLAEMTPFARNVYDLYQDKENITISRNELLRLSSPINYGTSKSGNDYYTKIDSIAYTVPLTAFTAGRGYTASDYLKGMIDMYSDSIWSGYYESVKAYL